MKWNSYLTFCWYWKWVNSSDFCNYFKSIPKENLFLLFVHIQKILQKMYDKNVLYVAKLFTFYLSNFLWTHLLVWVWQYNPKVMILKTMDMISKSSVLDVKKNCSDFAKKFIIMHKKRQTSFILLINFYFNKI